ncbi:hypothetical protein C2E20_5837 [Micractinium conductrix]|uniref:Uncharacterized protein n=1 Tax=Micractinium conductrix TaxID=554055 RepID=A0A2P6V9J3_9CHLO|nr:hypothetical protein C2E20_5837 [Micractinium conductrix]|eukprot:PSC70759.1 hypothetical protein C2E20_5837 [Micractinium conductrix]
MTLRNRQGRLERAGQLYNWRQARRIVTLLCDMTAKAVRVRDAADSQLSDLLGELEATHGYHTLQAVKLMLERVAATAQASAPALRLSPLAEYGQLRLQQEHVSNSAAACLPPAACLFRDSAAVRLAPGAAVRIRSLERALFNGEKPSLVRLPSGQSIADARLAEAAEAWASYEIQRLQTQLTRSAQQVQLMEHLITRLTSRPGELAKVRKSKQQLKARMEPVLASLMSWRAGG